MSGATLQPSFDPADVAAAIQQAALSSIQSLFPVVGTKRRLVLKRVWVEQKTSIEDKAGMKAAKLSGKTWADPVYAEVELQDAATGRPISPARKLRLMELPAFMPTTYSYLVDGTEQQVRNQIRLRSGAYSAPTRTGTYALDLMTSRGHNHVLELDPQELIFTITPSTSSAHIKLYPVLADLGIADSELARLWGPEILKANQAAAAGVRATEIEKFHKALFGETAPRDKAIPALHDYFATRTAIDPVTTKQTLGQSFDKVNPALLTAASAKLLAVLRGQAPPDDREGLHVKEFHAVDGFIREYIAESVKKIGTRLAAGVEKFDDPRLILGPNLFNAPVHSFFSKSSLASTARQINPVDMVSEQMKVTFMGEGGIASERSVPDELRQVHGTHLGFVDPIHTPESASVGTTLQLATGAARRGNQLVAPYVEARTGKVVELSPAEAYDKVLAFPGEFAKKGDRWVPRAAMIRAMVRGRETTVPASQVAYFHPSPQLNYGIAANLIPFLGSNSSARAMMATSHLTQAIPLTHREAPLVQTAMTPGMTFHDLVGREGTATARVAGTVAVIAPDHIDIKTPAGKLERHGLFNNYPLNSKTVLHNDVLVKVGDKVAAGQLLADSNFSRKGVLALGVNARTAIVPFGGYSFEDGICISESFAKRMTSQHVYVETIDVTPETRLDLGQFQARYPNVFKTEQAARLDADGVIKPGSKVSTGDPLVAKLIKEALRPEDKILAKLRRGSLENYKDRSILWERTCEGTVVDVVKSPKRVTISVRTEEPAKPGDKQSLVHGGKGVITKVLPDAEMPRTADQKPIEVLLNPNGIPGRMVGGPLLEQVAGKIAQKTGKPYIVSNFSGSDMANKVMGEAAKHGITDKEILYKPDGTPLGRPVSVGYNYIIKQVHKGDSKFSARGLGPYTEDLTPTSGDGTGGQALDILTVYSALAHGAKGFLSESAIKSQANPEFWRAFMTNQPLPGPKSTFAWNRFENTLRAAGVNVDKKGSTMSLMPFLDRHVSDFSRGKVDRPTFVLGKNLDPEKGGLFDPVRTGGLRGENWTHFELSEPLPHPAFEDPIKRLAKLKQAEYDGLVAGKLYLDPKSGALSATPGGQTGGTAIKTLLAKVNVKQRMVELAAALPKLTGAKLDQVNREYRILKALDEHKIAPTEYVVSKVPVLPPVFRPVYSGVNGDLRHSQVNFLYRDMMLVNQGLSDLHKAGVPDVEKTKQRADLYTSFQALVGVGAPKALSPQARDAKGMLAQIAGEAPKFGLFQSKVVRRRQDLTGRAVLTNGPELGIDEVGLPEEMAWTQWGPIIVRKLTALGTPFLSAQEAVKLRTPEARSALEAVARENLVVLNRPPSLHKFSLMAFHPTLVAGRSIRLPPLVYAGFNADVDGDSCLGPIQINVDITSAAAVFSEQEVAMFRDAKVPTTLRTWVEIEDFPHKPETRVLKGKNEEYDVPEGISVPAFDKTGFRVLPVTKFSIHPDCEEVEVETRNGRKVTCSADHSLIALDPDTLEVTKIVPREAVGRCAPVLARLPDAPMVTEIAWCAEDAKRRDRASHRDTLPADFGLGWFLGATAGDGWVSQGSGGFQLNLAAAARLHPVMCRWVAYLATLTDHAVTYWDNDHVFEGKQSFSVRATSSNNVLGAWLKTQIGAETGAANKHLPRWFLSGSEAFRRGLFVGMLDTDGTAHWGHRANPRKRKQFALGFTTISEEMAHGLRLLSLSLGMNAAIVETRRRDKLVFDVRLSIPDVQANLAWIKPVSPQKRVALEELEGFDTGPSRIDFVPLPPRLSEKIERLLSLYCAASVRPPERNDAAFSLYVVLKRRQGYLLRYTAKKVLELLPEEARAQLPPVWLTWVEDLSVRWDIITKATPTGQRRTMYDLTVPGAWTFVMRDGLAVQDTLSVHMPVMPAAQEDAKRMLPSSNLFNPTTGQLMTIPSQEAVQGLYFLTQTPAGRAEVNALLPPKFRDPARIISKKTLGPLMADIAKALPQEFPQIVDKLKNLGNKHAYDGGVTVGLSDLAGVDHTRRDRAFATADRAAAEVHRQKGPQANRDAQIISLYQKVDTAVQKMQPGVLAKANGGNNMLHHALISGAKGNADQIKQFAMAPVLYAGLGGKPVPIPIRHSLGEGLDPSEYWASHYGGRKSIIDKTKETAEPGALGKSLLRVAANYSITMDDCKTKHGIAVSTVDPRAAQTAIGHVLATGGALAPAGTIVSSSLLRQYIDAKVGEIYVRTPLVCEAPQGVCARCYGTSGPGGSFAHIGDNVGVVAGHAVAEPATQSILRTFHTGGLAGAAAGVTSVFDRVVQLLELPKQVPASATLAKAPGTVTRVEAAPAGGFHVWVDNQKHFAAPGHAVTVKPGQQVVAGAALSAGVVNPRDIADTQGPQAARAYIAKELHGIHHDMGVPIRKVHADMLAKAVTDHTKVLDPGDHPDYIPGDIAPLTRIEAFNAAGKGKPVRHQPLITGISMVPQNTTDWLDRLNSAGLRNTLLSGAAQHWRTTTKGPKPIPAYAIGTDFGEDGFY